MADLRDRTGNAVALTAAATVDQIWSEGATNCGRSPRGFEFFCAVGDCWLDLYGLNSQESGTTFTGGVRRERLVAGATPVKRFSFRGDAGTFSKINAELIGAGCVLTWRPCIN